MTDTGTAAETTTTQPSVEELKRLQKERDEKSAELTKLKAEADERNKKEKDAEEKNRKKKLEADGKLSEEFDRVRADNEKLQAELKSLRDMEVKRIDALAEKLPEGTKEKIVKWKEKISLTDYAEMVQDALDSSSGSRVEPTSNTKNYVPPIQPAGLQRVKDGVRQLQPMTLDLLDKHNVEAKFGEKLNEVEGVFGQSLRDFVKELRGRGAKPQVVGYVANSKD